MSPVRDDEWKNRAFEQIARRYADDLYRFAVWLSGDPALADDLVQETFVRAWKSIAQLKDVQAAKAWLITILRREYARTFERKVPRLVDIDQVVVADDQDSAAPEEQAHRSQVRREMLGLDPMYREPLVLQSLLGLSIAEIAEVTGLSQTAVMTRVFRARQQLSDRLGDRAQDEARSADNEH
ncbi:MAG: sigma-70 family RNA polymerase sigma factor [Wenzhouxiangellaceae bacterium]